MKHQLMTKLKTAAERSAGALTRGTRRGREGRRDGNSARRTGGTTSPCTRASKQASKQTHTHINTHFEGRASPKERGRKQKRSKRVEKRGTRANVYIRIRGLTRGARLRGAKREEARRIGGEIYRREGEKRNVETNERECIAWNVSARTRMRTNISLDPSLPPSTRSISLDDARFRNNWRTIRWHVRVASIWARSRAAPLVTRREGVPGARKLSEAMVARAMDIFARFLVSGSPLHQHVVSRIAVTRDFQRTRTLTIN